MTSAPTYWICQCGARVPMGCLHTCAHIGPTPGRTMTLYSPWVLMDDAYRLAAAEAKLAAAEAVIEAAERRNGPWLSELWPELADALATYRATTDQEGR